MDKPQPAGRNDGHETDYSQITDQIFIGSNLCEGKVCPIHGPEFERLGVNLEINLDNERREIPPENIDSYTWMPVVDGHPPNPDQLDTGTALMYQAIKNGRKIYIHCKNGHGRSPTLVAAYFIRYLGKSVEEAIGMVEGKRQEVHIEDRQKEALKKFEEKWLK